MGKIIRYLKELEKTPAEEYAKKYTIRELKNWTNYNVRESERKNNNSKITRSCIDLNIILEEAIIIRRDSEIPFAKELIEAEKRKISIGAYKSGGRISFSSSRLREKNGL